MAPSTVRPMSTKEPRGPWPNQVRFNGNGYLEVNKKLLNYQENMQLEIKLDFSTIESTGLIFWQGKADDWTFEYIALAIKDGQVH